MKYSLNEVEKMYSIDFIGIVSKFTSDFSYIHHSLNTIEIVRKFQFHFVPRKIGDVSAKAINYDSLIINLILGINFLRKYDVLVYLIIFGKLFAAVFSLR